jgi:O-antigen ligase
MNRELIDRLCERGILGLVLAVLVYGPIATGAVRANDLLVLQTLTGGALALWLIRLWFGESHRLLLPPVSWVVALFMGYAVLRYFQADIEYVARQEVIRVLLYGCLFFIIINHLHHQESLQLIAYVLIAIATIISAYAIYQFATNSPYVLRYVKPVMYMKRASGTYICPNHLAGFLEMIFPLALAYLFMGKVSHIVRVLIGYGVLMMLAGIGVTISRGGWIVTGIALLVFFALLIRKRSYRIPALIFLVFLVVGMIFAYSNAHNVREQFQQRFSSTQWNNIRLSIWKSAVEMWKDEPWLGVGPGHFDYRFRQYRSKNVQMRPERVHNDYLNTLADWGVVGFALVASAWLLMYLGALKTWKFVRHNPDGLTSRKTNKAAWVLGGCIGILAILLHSFLDFNFQIPANAILAVAIMALVSSHLRFATDRYWVSSGWVARLLVTAFCLASMGVFYVQGVRLWREQRVLEQAKICPVNSLKKAALLEKAWQIEPKNAETTAELGEIFRSECFAGERNSKDMGEIAIRWFERTRALNPFDAYNYMRHGMTLDFLRRFDEASPLMKRANELDPNGYYVLAHLGWHWVQLAANEERNSRYAQARNFYTKAIEWFDQSQLLNYDDNTVARRYKDIVLRKLAELAQKK